MRWPANKGHFIVVLRSFRSPFVVISVLLGFTLMSLWSLVLWKSRQEEMLAFAKADSETQGLTHSLAQHASKSFGAAALALLGAKQYIEHSDRSARASAEINDLLAAYARSIPQVREIGVLSETGSWMYSSFETVPTVNNGDREYFRYHQQNPDPTIRISEPLISRVTGRPTLLMTQRLSGRDGSFAGVVFAAIDLNYFRSFYRSFEFDQDRSITLMKTSGTVLVHRHDGEVGKNVSRTELFEKRILESTTGLYSIVSPFDGRKKHFAYEVAPDFPVVIAVALSEDEILKSWRHDRRFDLALTSGVSLVLLLLASLLASQFRKRQMMAGVLRERERGYRLLAENVDDVVTRVLATGKRLYISPSIEKLLGFTPAEIIDQSAYQNIHPAHLAVMKSLMQGLGPENRTAICEYMARRKDGQYIWLEAQFNFAVDERNGAAEIVAVVRNIAERKLAEEQLKTAMEQLKLLSETDKLTGIPNRRKFDDTLAREWARSRRSASELSVLMIDIDKFKSYNDSYGHGAGDECIRAVAQVLAGYVRRPGDFVARYGGEEFAAVLPDTSAQSAELVGNHLRTAVRDLGISHAGNAYGVVTISVGVAGGRGDVASASDILRSADNMLYVAKEHGRNRVCATDVKESPGPLVRSAG